MSVTAFFHQKKTEMRTDPIVDDDDRRIATPLSQENHRGKRRRSHRLNAGPENPIEIDDSDDDMTSTRNSLDKTVSINFADAPFSVFTLASR